MIFFNSYILLSLYILTIIYFVVLGCLMLAQRANPTCSHGEQVIKLRMTRSVGATMFLWAFDYLLYLPPLFCSPKLSIRAIDICDLITMLLVAPAITIVMHAIIQKYTKMMQKASIIALPFLLLTLWYVFVPELGGRLPIHLSYALSVLLIITLLSYHVKEYRIYVQRIKSEYSEISDREIFWSWSCFAGFSMQVIVFVIYNYSWENNLQLLYWGLSLLNAGFLCYCTIKQKPLDYEVVEESTDAEETANDTPSEQKEEKAFYPVIEQKLKSLCEEKLLFLEPDLTRETLCRHLSISSTYLKLYFRSRGLSFYLYINTLRVEYAYKLMEENPDMSIREVSEQSGFRSQTTFRKMFKEIMGCLPSELKSRKDSSAQ